MTSFEIRFVCFLFVNFDPAFDSEGKALYNSSLSFMIIMIIIMMMILLLFTKSRTSRYECVRRYM